MMKMFLNAPQKSQVDMFIKFFPLTPKKRVVWTKTWILKNNQKKRKDHVGPKKVHSGTLQFIVFAAVPKRDVCRSSQQRLLFLSGFLSDFLVKHMTVSPVADWLLLPANKAEEEDDEEEEQTSSHDQTNDHLSIPPF